MAAAVAVKKPASLHAVLLISLKKAWTVGSAGFVAGTMQVFAFMWLRTTMNYQVKNGGSFLEVLNKLWAEGGLARLYRGLLPWAIFQAPLSRFGDVAANEMVISVLGTLFPQIPVSVSTFLSSMTSACWRVLITPIDTCKTILQTDGDKGMKILKDKVAKGGPLVLWQGWEGNYIANVVGGYPWFAVMNYLSQRVPVPKGNVQKLIRSAFLGACASSATKEIVDKDGVSGILFRGLETRILTNVLQGAFFTVVWKSLSGAK